MLMRIAGDAVPSSDDMSVNDSDLLPLLEENRVAALVDHDSGVEVRRQVKEDVWCWCSIHLPKARCLVARNQRQTLRVCGSSI